MPFASLHDIHIHNRLFDERLQAFHNAVISFLERWNFVCGFVKISAIRKIGYLIQVVSGHLEFVKNCLYRVVELLDLHIGFVEDLQQEFRFVQSAGFLLFVPPRKLFFGEPK